VPFVTGLVLAAGDSTRLGRPKQLLPYGDTTLLGHVLATARSCRFDQLVCVLGGSAREIRKRVDLSGAEVVENHSFGEGCSSSIATALGAVDARADVLVLILGDQPGATAATVGALLAGRGDALLAACAYDDGRGHPLASTATRESGSCSTGTPARWPTSPSPDRFRATSTPTRTTGQSWPA